MSGWDDGLTKVQMSRMAVDVCNAIDEAEPDLDLGSFYQMQQVKVNGMLYTVTIVVSLADFMPPAGEPHRTVMEWVE